MAAKSLIKVWDKDGVEHEMSYANARDMVRLCGWSLSAPLKAAEADGEAETIKGKPNAPRRKKLESRSRKGLVEYARELGYTLDEGRTTNYMVWVCQQLEAGLTPEQVDIKMLAEHGPSFGLPENVHNVKPLNEVMKAPAVTM